MVVKKAKKVGSYRGHTTHGGGHRKKRRGAGSRGGRGNAGTGKRAGQKKAGIKNKTLGRVKGFVPRRNIKTIKSLNLSYFTPEKLNHLIENGKIEKKSDVYFIDMNKLGYNKLLGTGNVTVKLEISVSSFSKLAEEKINKAGGKLLNETSLNSSKDESKEE
ncbi:50S ribosomal protein L15 [archaeon]|jgi:large subunit ribosomal protein L15|nr:50S ribosomal protein L15 [archaeon]MBT3450706.1 50S ribosomal protein L15 [archaeon]MBT6869198.1 50S ribosomal protein L15 [archaeon]MBT7193734.1 50S ribosomal protein L15 [archaeon]MBT7381381.1 50S ribosomal protein L15 [archaeon]